MVSLSQWGPITTLNQQAYWKPTIEVPPQNEWFA